MAVEPASETEPLDVETLANRLGTAIADLPAYREYVETQEEIQRSEEAREAVSAFQEARDAFVRARQADEAVEAAFSDLRAAEAEMQSVPEVADHVEAQSALNARLSDLNRAISAPLAIDFGQEAGGCCQDD